MLLFVVESTPAVNSSKVYTSRLTSGRLTICALVVVCPNVALEVSTSGASEVMETVSLTAPASSAGSMRALRLTSSTMPLRTYFLKPVAVTSIRYRPMGRNWIEYWPDESVVAAREKLVSTLIAVTCAFGTTAPAVSLTVPEIVTVVTCAATLAAEATRIESSAKRRKRDCLLIDAPYSSGDFPVPHFPV